VRILGDNESNGLRDGSRGVLRAEVRDMGEECPSFKQLDMNGRLDRTSFPPPRPAGGAQFEEES
jgi:hypothetical protein